MKMRNTDGPVVQIDKPRAAKSRSAEALLKTRAYDELRSRILNNDLPAGSFLAERQLARELGMSKTPVKAALERLQQEGFVAISPQQGIVVRDLSVQEIADQYELCEALESYILRALAGRLAKPQIDRLRSNLRAQEAIKGSNDVPQWVTLNTEFHLLFPDFLGNEEIRRILGQLRDRMQRILTRVFHLDPARIDSSYQEHLAIADAVIAGDGPRAAQLAAAHLQTGRQLILVPRGQRMT
jgi:DNA-binding GntR family transcriptional regulator